MQTHHIDGETGFLFVSEMINCTCLTVTPGSEYKKDGGRRLLLFFLCNCRNLGISYIKIMLY